MSDFSVCISHPKIRPPSPAVVQLRQPCSSDICSYSSLKLKRMGIYLSTPKTEKFFEDGAPEVILAPQQQHLDHYIGPISIEASFMSPVP
ncbi:Hypothetical predicted protein [Olea europaea subsp. europaea]|uniref:Uncharacterized protein n=1 Tax=Olea europaea subsp. europaea TaxID=158383 RepID=A0A8S0VM14_OLEEU|nr:Hypothetical predicted protein [Olea europaea subsp. europaea]